MCKSGSGSMSGQILPSLTQDVGKEVMKPWTEIHFVTLDKCLTFWGFQARK